MVAFQSRQVTAYLSSEEDTRLLLERIAKTAQAEAAAVYYGMTAPSIAAVYGGAQFPPHAPPEELEALDSSRLHLDPGLKSVVCIRFADGLAFLVVDSGREQAEATLAALAVIESVFSLGWNARRRLELCLGLSARHVERREKELLALSQKIHNELSQNLTLIRLELASMARQLQQPDVRLKADLEELIETAKQVSDSVIEISNNLRPPMVESIGPVLALRHEAKRLQATTGITVDCDLQEVAMHGKSSLAVLRIAQECLANISRHSGANQVRMSLAAGDAGWTVLHIEDNGCGFHLEQNTQALGLAEMREQAGLVGGTLTIESSPGIGTRICAHFPVQAESNTKGAQ